MMSITQYFTPDFISNSTYVVSSIYILGIGLVFLYVLSNGPKTIPTPTDATRPRDPARLAEDLPTDVALTPEDFRNDPELLDMFEITDVNNVNIILESNEHFQNLQSQEVVLTFTQKVFNAMNSSQEILFELINYSQEIILALINAFPFF